MIIFHSVQFRQAELLNFRETHKQPLGCCFLSLFGLGCAHLKTEIIRDGGLSARLLFCWLHWDVQRDGSMDEERMRPTTTNTLISIYSNKIRESSSCSSSPPGHMLCITLLVVCTSCRSCLALSSPVIIIIPHQRTARSNLFPLSSTDNFHATAAASSESILNSSHSVIQTEILAQSQ